ncbi:MAG: hypothetical protein ABEK59_09995 [Halobacteria archaeon]
MPALNLRKTIAIYARWSPNYEAGSQRESRQEFRTWIQEDKVVPSMRTDTPATGDEWIMTSARR